MTARSLLLTARARLGDGKSNRWSNTRLLNILDSGHKHFCKVSGIYRKEAYIPINEINTRYNLPTDCVTVDRIEYDGNLMQLFSRNDLDDNRIRRSSVVAIKDNLNMGILDIVPNFTALGAEKIFRQGFETLDTFSFPDPYGVIVGVVPNDITLDSLYGTVTGLELGTDSFSQSTKYGELNGTTTDILKVSFVNGVYGVVTGIEFSNNNLSKNLFGFITETNKYKVVGKYGITGAIVPTKNYIKLFYSALPRTITLDTQQLVLHDMWETAMIHYIVGTALQDDNDASNIQRGEMELQKYTNEVLKARELTSKDFSGSQKDKLTTRFRRF